MKNLTVAPLVLYQSSTAVVLGRVYLGISSFSGSVIAIYGAERNDGKFTVEDFCMADLPLQTPRPALNSDR